MNFAEKLKAYRKELESIRGERVGQIKLAEELGISRGNIGSLESGKRTPSKKLLIKLAKHSGKPLEYWMNGLYDDVSVDLHDKYIFIDLKIFGRRLKELMDANNDTIYSLAEFLHLTAPTISKYTNGQLTPKLLTVECIANKYKVSVDYLLGYTDNIGNDSKEDNIKVIDNNYLHSKLSQEEFLIFLLLYKKLNIPLKCILNINIDEQ